MTLHLTSASERWPSMLQTMYTAIEKALLPWGNYRVEGSLTGGYRNAAYLVELEGNRFVAKTSRRNEPALVWLEDVHKAAREAGFVIPKLIQSENGAYQHNGLTLEPFVEGRTISSNEIPELLERIGIFHQLTQDLPQRPGFASSVELLEIEQGGDVDLAQMPPKLVQICREAWQVFAGEPRALVDRT